VNVEYAYDVEIVSSFKMWILQGMQGFTPRPVNQAGFRAKKLAAKKVGQNAHATVHTELLDLD